MTDIPKKVDTSGIIEQERAILDQDNNPIGFVTMRDSSVDYDLHVLDNAGQSLINLYLPYPWHEMEVYVPEGVARRGRGVFNKAGTITCTTKAGTLHIDFFDILRLVFSARVPKISKSFSVVAGSREVATIDRFHDHFDIEVSPELTNQEAMAVLGIAVAACLVYPVAEAETLAPEEGSTEGSNEIAMAQESINQEEGQRLHRSQYSSSLMACRHFHLSGNVRVDGIALVNEQSRFIGSKVTRMTSGGFYCIVRDEADVDVLLLVVRGSDHDTMLFYSGNVQYADNIDLAACFGTLTRATTRLSTEFTYRSDHDGITCIATKPALSRRCSITFEGREIAVMPGDSSGTLVNMDPSIFDDQALILLGIAVGISEMASFR
nr:hypothetical protein [Candidatus Sigynarchaeota archaeon]